MQVEVEPADPVIWLVPLAPSSEENSSWEEGPKCLKSNSYLNLGQENPCQVKNISLKWPLHPWDKEAISFHENTETQPQLPWSAVIYQLIEWVSSVIYSSLSIYSTCRHSWPRKTQERIKSRRSQFLLSCFTKFSSKLTLFEAIDRTLILQPGDEYRVRSTNFFFLFSMSTKTEKRRCISFEATCKTCDKCLSQSLWPDTCRL